MNTLTSLTVDLENEYEGEIGVLTVEKINYAGSKGFELEVKVNTNSVFSVALGSDKEALIERAKKHYDYNESYFLANNDWLFV
jgi:hypothetical protein